MSNHFVNVEQDINQILNLRKKLSGKISSSASSVDAFVSKSSNGYTLNINDVLDLGIQDTDYVFTYKKIKLIVAASINAHRNAANINKKWASRYSEANVSSFKTASFLHNEEVYCRSFFYFDNDRLLYDFFGTIRNLHITINSHRIIITQDSRYLIIESITPIKSDLFSEICYNTLVGIGFISGHFIQNECYTFQYADEDKKELIGYKYRKLRPSHSSIYHTVADPSSYEGDLIDNDFIKNLCKQNPLCHFDGEALSRLIELIYFNKQIQYALVLFNEANGNGLSLLIKNNCFYAVLEVLRKFLHDEFKNKLPKDYSTKSNIYKYKAVLENLFPLSEEECITVEKRNVYMHGDIKEIDGDEMVDLMHKQISLIYKIITTYVKYDGYIIDHYAIRNSLTEQSFVRIEQLRHN